MLHDASTFLWGCSEVTFPLSYSPFCRDLCDWWLSLSIFEAYVSMPVLQRSMDHLQPQQDYHKYIQIQSLENPTSKASQNRTPQAWQNWDLKTTGKGDTTFKWALKLFYTENEQQSLEAWKTMEDHGRTISSTSNKLKYTPMSTAMQRLSSWHNDKLRQWL